jgi:hypothetical protein
MHIVAALLLGCAGFAQVSSVPPTNHWSAVPIGLRRRVEVSHNQPDVIRRELLDTNTIRVIAESTGLRKDELATIALAPDPVDGQLWLYVTKESDRATKANGVFAKKLQFYVWGRLDGHTRGFLLNALTNRVQLAGDADPDLRALLEQRPDLAGSLLERGESGFYTNQLERVFRRVKYCLRDGEVAWCFDFCLTPDRTLFNSHGTAFNISEWRVDAKECDPKFRTIFQEVDAAVSAEMKAEGAFGKPGSARSFWEMKKEKLKARGITWRSPDELNPGVIFD